MPNAKQYAKYKEKMSQNPDLYMKEKERINNIVIDIKVHDYKVIIHHHYYHE